MVLCLLRPPRSHLQGDLGPPWAQAGPLHCLTTQDPFSVAGPSCSARGPRQGSHSHNGLGTPAD